MEWILTFFRTHPLIPVFITLGLGFWLGRVRFRGFSLGSIAATLIVGVIIGQIDVDVPDLVKNVFFLFFLFATGYSVGPQFVRAMRGPGLRLAAFAAIEALVCAALIIGAALLMGYDNGIATGLFAGAQTASACLGMVSDTVKELPVSADTREYLLTIIPACYAVTYMFGTVGTAWFLSTIAPKMMGGLDKVRKDTARIEDQMDNADHIAPGQIHASRPVSFRAYEATSDFFATPRSIDEIEERFASQGWRVFVERARVAGQIADPSPAVRISRGDHVVLAGRMEEIVDLQSRLGSEVTDPELLNFGAQKTPVTISTKGGAGLTFAALRSADYMERVMVASITRAGFNIPIKAKTELNAGDIVTLVGWPRDVAAAAARIGYADPQTDVTDMVFLGLGIAAGCIIGALSITIGGVPFGLGASVGALLMGLLLGWWRSRRPTFGRIPEAALWVFKNLGANMFIAVIGLSAGSSFLYGLRHTGWPILLIGAACTLLGLLINIFIARRLFRFSAPETLGCVAGGRCSVASITAINSALRSDVPNLSFTITYAVANITLIFSSLIVLFLVP